MVFPITIVAQKLEDADHPSHLRYSARCTARVDSTARMAWPSS